MRSAHDEMAQIRRQTSAPPLRKTMPLKLSHRRSAAYPWLRSNGKGHIDLRQDSDPTGVGYCPVTVDLPFCQWIFLVRRFCHRSCPVADLDSSHSVAPEAPDLDLQTSNHQVHRRGTRLLPGQPNLRLSKIHWRKPAPHTDKPAPRGRLVRH